jgi:hypothetical protein
MIPSSTAAHVPSPLNCSEMIYIVKPSSSGKLYKLIM